MNVPFSGNRVQDPVTKRTQKEEFPTRAEFTIQTGYNDDALFKAWLLMYGSGFGIIDYSGNPQTTHYNDAATTQNARFPKSGYVLRPTEMGQEFHHDVPEDVSKEMAKKYAKAQHHRHRPTAAYVLIDIIDGSLQGLLDADARRTLVLRTNFGKMIFDPVVSLYKTLAEQQPGKKLIATPGELSGRLNEAYANFSIPPDSVRKFYREIIGKWGYVSTLVESASYLPSEERAYIVETLRQFSEGVKIKLKTGDAIQAADIGHLVKRELERVHSLIGSNNLEEVDPNLILPKQVELVEKVKKTIYKQYIRDMMEAVIKDAAEHVKITYTPDREANDSYLYPGLGKFSDARDTVTRMGPNMDNVISQFRKQRIILEEGAEVAKKLREMNLPYNRWWGGMNFLYTGLNDELDRLERHYKKGLGRQTVLENPHDMILHMQKLMRTFKPTRGLRPAGRIANKWTSVRQQGITALI